MIEIKENFDKKNLSLRTWNIYGAGKFGDVYALTVRDLEELFVQLGDKIGEIKGGIGYIEEI